MLGQVVAPLSRGVTPRSPAAAACLAGGVLTLGLSIVSVGLPATLILLGAWSLAFGYARLHTALRGPASWAAGIVTEAALLSALDFAKALISGREHGLVVHLVLLLVPVVAGLVLAALPRRTPDTPEHIVAEPRASRTGLALAVTAAGLLVPIWVSSHGHAYDVAWALSGDGRNHVLILRGLLAHGGVTIAELKTYPALVNTISAIVSAAGGRRGLAPGSLMLHDARAISETYVVTGIGLATMFVAAILESLPRAVATAKRLPLGVLVTCLVAAATTVSSFVLGTSLLDGFFSTYGTLCVVTASVVLALRCTVDPSPYAYGLLGAATVFAVFGWTVLAVVPFAATLVVTVTLALGPRARLRTPTWLVAAVVAIGGVLVTLGILVTQYDTLRTQFLTPGPVPTPLKHWVLYLIGLVALAVLGAATDRRTAGQRSVSVAAAALGIGTIWWLRHITPDHQTWTYYAAKALWAISATLLWALFVPVALAVSAAPARLSRWRTWAIEPVQCAAAAVAVVVVVGFLTEVKDPLHEAKNGWTQPSAAVVREAALLGDQRKPFVLWGWSDPGDERLGDFLAELTWGSTAAGLPLPLPESTESLYTWGYTDNGQFSQLCLLARATPDLDVITQDRTLHDKMRDSCPASGAHVIVVPRLRYDEAS